eukprot:1713173-Prorocentrum_lima.AAC.1
MSMGYRQCSRTCKCLGYGMAKARGGLCDYCHAWEHEEKGKIMMLAVELAQRLKALEAEAWIGWEEFPKH